MQNQRTNQPVPIKSSPQRPRRRTQVGRAVVEIGFIVFLFYSNLLMGEFDAANGRGKTLVAALVNIFTVANLGIALISAMAGYLVFEFLRKKL
jgi:hypothetical protein